MRLATTHKLNPRFIGTFVVTAGVGHVAYKLDLPAAYSALFPIFMSQNCVLVEIMEVMVGLWRFTSVKRWLEELKVDFIVGKYECGKRYQFRVCWQGYGIADDSWLSKADLINAANIS